MGIRTTDGNVYYNEVEARAHQDGLDNKASAEARAHNAAIASRFNAIHDATYSELWDAFKSRNWDMVIKILKDDDITRHMRYGIAATKILGIALAYKNDDYGMALNSYFRPFVQVDKDWVIETNEPTDELDEAYSAGKKAWKRVHGREMTNADMKQAQIEFFERKMRENSEITDSYFVWFDVDRWERVTGKKMTKAEQTRIIGRPFPEDTSNFYKGTTSSVDDDQRNGFVSFLFGLVGAVGSVLGLKLLIIPRINLVDEWILVISICLYLIVPLVTLGVTYSAWRNKRNILLIIMLALIVPGYIGFIGAKVTAGKSAKPQTTQSVTITQQADITQNVNFRKDPSTGDNIIRQLKKGDTVTLTGEVSEGWTQITHDGDTGWVSSEFLKVYGK